MKRNNTDIILPECGLGEGIAGNVYQAMANASRFDSAFSSTTLTNFAVGGWDNDPLQDFLEFYAPAVVVPDRFDYKIAEHADFFQQLDDDSDIRPMGGAFGRIDTARMEEVESRLDEKGLTIVVDKREIEADPDAEDKAITRVSRILLRTECRRATGMLKAAATNTNKVWADAADPDMDVLDELQDVRDTVGIGLNRVGFGGAAYSRRKRTFRAQNTSGSNASAMMSPADIAAEYGVEFLAFEEARFRNSNGLGTYIGNDVIMFNAASGVSKDDPSNIKRFVGNIDGQPVMVYRREFARTIEITVAHKSKQAITSTLGIRKFTTSAE